MDTIKQGFRTVEKLDSSYLFEVGRRRISNSNYNYNIPLSSWLRFIVIYSQL